jgi:GT2 family glycosyltransferase
MNITAVVVLYKCSPDQSPTIASLVRSFGRGGASGAGFSLLVYDNSPQAQPFNLQLSFAHRYVHDPLNGGLAAAYNLALDSDPQDPEGWLLLLDQDTALPEDFLEQSLKALERIGPDPMVAAAVPRIFQEGRLISPARVSTGRVSPVKDIGEGVGPKGLTAINSGALVRERFLREIGGFNPKFKLDYLDHWLFSEVNRRDKMVYVTGAVVKHDLSVSHIESRVSKERYLSILNSETRFYRNYAGGWNFPCHLMVLALRSVRHLVHRRWVFFLKTARHFFTVLSGPRH